MVVFRPVEEEDGETYRNITITNEEKEKHSGAGGRMSPAPTVDRTKKPTRSSKPGDADANDSPLKSNTMRINRIDSFVKKCVKTCFPWGV